MSMAQVTISQDSLPIGLFDSGVGGLTVLKSLKSVLPKQNYIYLGDTARTPYGTKSRETVERYAIECSDFLASCGVKIIVVACNTASAAALATLEAKFACPVIGTIEPIVDRALLYRPKKVLVLGTEATIRSQAYYNSIMRRDSEIEVFSKACPLFVPLVEEGFWSGALVDEAIKAYLAEYRDVNPDVVILGCTHYPLLSQALEKFFGSSTKIVESSGAVAEAVLSVVGNSPSSSGRDKFYLTDPTTKFRQLAKTLLGEDIEAEPAYVLDNGLSREAA